VHHAVDHAPAPAANEATHAEQSRSAALQRAHALHRAGRAWSDATRVTHVSALRAAEPARDAIVLALDAVACELKPLAATFFRVGPDGEIASSVVHASHLPPAEVARQVRTWKATLRMLDPLAPRRLPTPPGRIATLRDVGEHDGLPSEALVRAAYRQIGVANDVRLLVRDGDRVVAGVTLWRGRGSRPWTSAHLRTLRTVQPLVELAYLSQLAEPAGVDAALPETLTRREREVARLLATGVTNAELARALHVSPNTAKSHTRAVLSKLGVTSRRTMVARLGPASRTPLHDAAPPQPTAAADLLRPARREPGDPLLWLEGPPAQQALLAPILGWASERIGAVAGGCAVLSPRHALVGHAFGTAHVSAHRLDRRLVRQLHEEVLATQVLRSAATDPAQVRVAPLDAFVSTTARARLDDLVPQLGVTAPTVILLRPRGRVAALAWIAQDARAALDERASARALRCVHPLLEIACAGPLAAEQAQGAARPNLLDAGLTGRELTVARLALGGAGNEEIARELRVAESTVKNHMTRVLAKCGVRSRTELIATYGTAEVSRAE
jgi:DNA-binding NarL/FixJ family response regulator